MKDAEPRGAATTREGRVDVPAPPAAPAGPGTARPDTPFYNPAMALNRDLSVLTVAAECRRRGRDLDVADALAGAGARALRLAAEVPHALTVHANDRRPDAVAALVAAAQQQGAEERVRAHRGDAHAFLASRRFDVVDIDPYGSPAPFLDAAVHATRHDGLLLLTATDTAALSGTYPRVVRRRYAAWHGLHGRPWRAEVGLRILAGAAVRAAARHERGARVLWSVSAGHWMRVALRIRDGAAAADAALRDLRWAVPDARGGGAFVGRAPAELPEGPVEDHAGPLASGPLHDAATVAAMADALEACPPHTDVRPLLDVMRQECTAPAFWIDLDDAAARLGRPTPRTRDVLERLRSRGHEAAPSHMGPKGVRTDAGLGEVLGVPATAKPS